MNALDAIEKAKKDSAEAGNVTFNSPAQSEPEAPATGEYKVRFETTAGDFTVLVHRDWAPIGAERFHQLVTSGFFNDAKFFRVIEGFMVQFGLAADPALNERWDRNLRDDPVVESNKRGRITFATAGPNTRTTQVFINFGDNSRLDADGFAAFGEVIEGMENVDSIYNGYGESPDQGRIRSQGNSYLDNSFPNLDSIKSATIITE